MKGIVPRGSSVIPWAMGLAVIACVSRAKTKENSEPEKQPQSLTAALEAPDPELDALIQSIEKEIDEKTPITTPSRKAPEALRLELNAHVERWIQYFTSRDRERFTRFLGRGEPYRSMIEKTLIEKQVPKELYYLALIESGFQTHAASHAQAVGIWQFISGTGKRYGLSINKYNDERKDPLRSTQAAADYLANLHKVFNCWYLAMAAYNAGEARIMNAIMRENSRDFWTLVERKALPRETMEYIPKIIAAATIASDLGRFGLNPIEPIEVPALVQVDLPASVSFKTVAKHIPIAIDQLKRLNPGLKRGVAPPGRSAYAILIPQELEAQFKEKAPLFKKDPNLKPEPGPVVHYKVKRGDSLNTIASKFKVPVRSIKAHNSLRSNKIIAGDVLKIVSNRG